MYETSPEPNVLFQGDVLRGVVIVALPAGVDILRPDGEAGLLRPVRREDCEDAFASGREAIIAEATVTDVAIISQTCDIQRKQFVTVAAVSPIPAEWGERKRQDLRRWDRMLNMFYLAPSGDFPESVADFSMLYTFGREKLMGLMDHRVLSLDASSRQLLQYKLSQFFGRPAID